ncbi:hypothetical protein O1611_g1464 [Lasiodiplodia mahajangana]|uniref:Uncharacterized protein n=1 Tax=Lasiodiplodia mahajangana TaxID=1108764 RepID=A0ACC2JXL2_9PEZI|nr:hypothetical protein O1611_g1464 [Lasiodiplodia mahajangana]
MAELIGLLSTCAELLSGIIKAIEKTTEAWDRTKNGKKYLDNVVIQVRITREILQNIVKVKKKKRGPEVYSAVELVHRAAKELGGAVDRLAKSYEEGSMKIFLDELFRGTAREKNFDKLQRDLYHAQTLLILALVASKVSNTNFFRINIKTMKQVKQCFVRCQGTDSSPPVVRLLEEKGTSPIHLTHEPKTWLHKIFGFNSVLQPQKVIDELNNLQPP